MSVSFYIKNKRKFLTYEKVMTINQIINLYQKDTLSIYNFNFNDENFDKDKFLNSSLEKHKEKYNCILFGVEGKSTRGFEFSYDDKKKSYVIREYTPSSENDWFIALDFMKALAKKLNSDIKSEHGEVFNIKNINTFNYRNDILAGIHAISNNFNKDKDANVEYVFGIKRPVAFNREIIGKIMNSNNIIEEFSKFCEDIQNLDAYTAKQFFVDDKELSKKWAYYVLTENTRTILPYKPMVEFFSMDYIKNNEVAFWKIFFCAYKVNKNQEEDIENIGELLYEGFIKKLPVEKYKFIDASYILIEALSREEIFDLLK